MNMKQRVYLSLLIFSCSVWIIAAISKDYTATFLFTIFIAGYMVAFMVTD